MNGLDFLAWLILGCLSALALSPFFLKKHQADYAYAIFASAVAVGCICALVWALDRVIGL